MKDGCVNAVIVGADRVAANGDTTNKIGTYSLALCAKHHNIPFYVAAPLTSINLSLTSGQEIVIEERSPKEILISHGGLGEQIAASWICVWNPTFNVTPSSLISVIITEKGQCKFYAQRTCFKGDSCDFVPHSKMTHAKRVNDH